MCSASFLYYFTVNRLLLEQESGEVVEWLVDSVSAADKRPAQQWSYEKNNKLFQEQVIKQYRRA